MLTPPYVEMEPSARVLLPQCPVGGIAPAGARPARRLKSTGRRSGDSKNTQAPSAVRMSDLDAASRSGIPARITNNLPQPKIEDLRIPVGQWA
jgi:hypothetical protein